jgi:hypothetical protein
MRIAMRRIVNSVRERISMIAKNILIVCQISTGVFSGERMFEVQLADGSQTYSGIAPLHYFRKEDGGELTASDPPGNNTIKGTLTARLVRNGGKTALVAIPDGEAITVPADIIHEPKYVPIRS